MIGKSAIQVKTYKTRHQFYLPDALSEKLDVLAARPGASKTGIMTAALHDLIERKGASELDERFGPRLDRQAAITATMARNTEALLEMLGTFIAHQLTMTAHHPAFDEESRTLGARRYEAFISAVGQRVAKQVSQKMIGRAAMAQGEHRQEANHDVQQ